MPLAEQALAVKIKETYERLCSREVFEEYGAASRSCCELRAHHEDEIEGGAGAVTAQGGCWVFVGVDDRERRGG